MSKEQVEHFEFELDKLIHRFREEYELSIAEALGTLRIVQAKIEKEALEE